jgi:hypothetical protein
MTMFSSSLASVVRFSGSRSIFDFGFRILDWGASDDHGHELTTGGGADVPFPNDQQNG